MKMLRKIKSNKMRVSSQNKKRKRRKSKVIQKMMEMKQQSNP